MKQQQCLVEVFDEILQDISALLTAQDQGLKSVADHGVETSMLAVRNFLENPQSAGFYAAPHTCTYKDRNLVFRVLAFAFDERQMRFGITTINAL